MAIPTTTPSAPAAQQTAQQFVPSGTGKMSMDDIAKTMLTPSTAETDKAKATNDPADPSVRGEADLTAGEDGAGGRRSPPSREKLDGEGEAVDAASSPSILDDAAEDGGGEADEDEDAAGTSNSPVTEEDDEGDGGEDDILSAIFDDESAGEKSRDDEGADTADQPDLSQLGDDATLSVTVDGKEEQVTLGELKRRYAGNGAIEKRLQETTELRNAVQQDYDNGRQIIEAVFQQFGQALFRRTVPQPDDGLLDTNPTAYMKQKALYDQETTALIQSQTKLQTMMQNVDEINKKQVAERRKQAAAELRRIMPVFNDPQKGPKVRDAIISAAKEIGYTDADIAAAEHPLMFKTMALAARELRRQKLAKVGKAPITSTSTPKRGSNKKPIPQKNRQQKAAVDRARKTGSVDDVAATMLVPQKRRGRR